MTTVLLVGGLVAFILCLIVLPHTNFMVFVDKHPVVWVLIVVTIILVGIPLLFGGIAAKHGKDILLVVLILFTAVLVWLDHRN